MQSETETLGELFKALALAQNEMEAATTDATNPFFKSKYAKLEHVVKASRPFLSKHGLSVSQRPFMLENGQRVLLTRLCHSSGEWMEGCMSINPPKEDIQAMGSYITYLRRYNYSCITGVVTEDEADDDGNMAKEAQKKDKEPTLISDIDISELAVRVCDRMDIIDSNLMEKYLKRFRKNLSSVKDPLESICNDKFASAYEKWLAENPPAF